MSIRKNFCFLLAALTFTGTAFAQAPDVKPQRIRGEIVSFQANLLKVHRHSGDVASIEIKPGVLVSALKPIRLSEIKPGTYVGAAAITGSDGKLTASSVLVFPDAARGTNEGHFAYDFGPKSTMTNASVDTVVTGTSGRDLKLSYEGGSDVVTVPDSVPVVTFAPATDADLVSGKKVVVVVTPAKDGEFEAHVVLVEKDGVVPPL